MYKRLQTLKRPRFSWLRTSTVLAAGLFQVARAEEESMMTGATIVKDYGKAISYQSPNPDVLIGPGFKSYAFSDDCCLMAEFTIDFGEPKTVHSIFLNDVAKNFDDEQETIGVSHIRAGNDRTEFSTTNVVVRDNIVDGGFFKLD